MSRQSSLTVRGIPLASARHMLLHPYQRAVSDVRHVFICVADHYEPYWGAPPASIAEERVLQWERFYPQSVEGIYDSRGQIPQHSFFYPAEDYDPKLMDRIATLCQLGYGDVEVHLHHDNDTSSGFRDQIESFTHSLHEQHGLLRRDAQGRISYGFIHGNWALDNARPDGKWCGVNDEISILQDTGCYADLTLPCAPEPGQTRMVNSIYYAIDDPEKPKSHDVGILAEVGVPPPESGLLMVQGPLAWNWRQRKWGLVPRLENGDLHGAHGPTVPRFETWLRTAPAVKGKPDWVFIKLHTHGAFDVNTELFLGGRVREFHQQLANYAAEHEDLRYYYVTAHEMASLIRQAQNGCGQPELPPIRFQNAIPTR